MILSPRKLFRRKRCPLCKAALIIGTDGVRVYDHKKCDACNLIFSRRKYWDNHYYSYDVYKTFDRSPNKPAIILNWAGHDHCWMSILNDHTKLNFIPSLDITLEKISLFITFS